MENLFTALAKLTDVECFNYCAEQLERFRYKIDIGEKYLIASPKRPNYQSKVGLVAHCDTVATHRKNEWPPQKFKNDEGVISVKGGGILGADDRAGISAILKIVHDGQRPHVYLTMDEEIGAVGAESLVSTITECPNPVNVLIQIDRRGEDDYVTYDCDSKELNDWAERFGWNSAIGSFSDISVICPQWEIAGVNVSCGYYDEHSSRECLILPELERSVRRIKKMIDNPPSSIIKYVSGNYTYWSNQISFYENRFNPNEEDEDAHLSMYKCAECKDYYDWDEFDFQSWLCLECKEWLFEQYSAFIDNSNSTTTNVNFNHKNYLK